MQQANYQVRLIEEADFEAVAAVWRTTWTATYELTLGNTALKEMLRDLNDNGASGMIPEKAQGLCIIDDGKIIGTAVYSAGGPKIYLWGMYVLPEYQRSGAGSLLLQVARAAAGKRSIEVRVLKSSAHANSFYRKHGFQTVGLEQTEILPGVTETCLVMQQAV